MTATRPGDTNVQGLRGLLNRLTGSASVSSAPTSVTVTVSPVATGSYTVGAVDHSTGALAGQLKLSNAQSTVSYDVAGGPSHGMVTLDHATGAFTYTPFQVDRHQAAAEAATPDQLQDSFTVRATSADGVVTSVPVSVGVDPANAAPVMNLVVSNPESDGTVHVSLAANDPDNDPVVYMVVHDPAYGTLTRVPGGYTYTPNAEAVSAGADSFQIMATDLHHGSDTQTATVTVGPVSTAATPTLMSATTVSPSATASKSAASRISKTTKVATATATSSTVTTNVTIEGESLTLNPSRSGSKYSDSTASGKSALLMSTNGTASKTVNLPASSQLIVRAKGDQYNGSPTMTVSIDGKVVSTVQVSSTTWTDYTIPISTTAGTHTVSIGYTNELRASASKDRNLRVDKITVVAGAVTTTPTTQSPTYFQSADWLWKPIAADAKTDPNSATWVSYLAAPGAHHAADMYDYGVTLVPASAVNNTTPRYDVGMKMPWGSDPFGSNKVAIPKGVKLPAGDDSPIAILDPSTGQAYGLWQAKYDSTTDSWTASWGGMTPLNGNGVDTSGSGTGSGISRYAGVVGADEFQTAIDNNTGLNHALVFSTDIAGSTYVGPARKSDGANLAGVATPIPEGARVQLDPSINVDAIPGITPGEKVIAKTLQTYGAYVVDQGGSRMAFSFETVPDATSTENVGAVYENAGLTWDYYDMNHIPWSSLRVVSQ